MRALDFEFDELLLSNFGCIICTFDNPGMQQVSLGSNISFNSVSVNSGKTNYLTSTRYDECLSTTFDICKKGISLGVTHMIINEDDILTIGSTGQKYIVEVYGNSNEATYFTLAEQRALMRWLNRREYLPLKIIDSEYEDIFFEGSFNVEKYDIAGNTVGFRLTFYTNKPFAQYDEFSVSRTVAADGTIDITDQSDEMGYIYPEITITCRSAGNLRIVNSMDERETVINNVTNGEVITMKDLYISTSESSHVGNLPNDFNFVFPRISNTYDDRLNTFSFNLPCTVTFKYNPIWKVGF